MENQSNGENVYVRFPQGVDKFLQFFDWEIDELVPLIIAFMLGIVLRSPLIVVFGVVMMKLYISAKRKYPNNFIFIFFYTVGLVNIKGSLPGHIKKFME